MTRALLASTVLLAFLATPAFAINDDNGGAYKNTQNPAGYSTSTRSKASVDPKGAQRAASENARKKFPLSEEEKQERELEAVYGTQVERDRLDRGGRTGTTFDRYGDGPVGVFQNNNKSDRGVENSDSIGVNVRLFEFE
ncbi:MAG: hypothetical protein AB7E85_05550 [Pseudobdellovibrionaceae bacterium]